MRHCDVLSLPSNSRYCSGITPLIVSSNADNIALIRNNSDESTYLLLSLFFEPFGRPLFPFFLVFDVAVFAVEVVLFTCSEFVLTICSIRKGNDSLSLKPTRDRAKNASPLTGRLDKLEKNQSTP